MERREIDRFRKLPRPARGAAINPDKRLHVEDPDEFPFQLDTKAQRNLVAAGLATQVPAIEALIAELLVRRRATAGDAVEMARIHRFLLRGLATIPPAKRQRIGQALAKELAAVKRGRYWPRPAEVAATADALRKQADALHCTLDALDGQTNEYVESSLYLKTYRSGRALTLAAIKGDIALLAHAAGKASATLRRDERIKTGHQMSACTRLVAMIESAHLPVAATRSGPFVMALSIVLEHIGLAGDTRNVARRFLAMRKPPAS